MAGSVFSMRAMSLQLPERFIETVRRSWGDTRAILEYIVQEIIDCVTFEGPGGEKCRRLSDDKLGYDIARVTRMYALSGDSVVEFEERLRREGLLLKRKPIVVVVKAPMKTASRRRKKG